ncbi:leucine-rich repeat-containing protein 34 isoform X3 [Archocentrus centrarchus]|uniref:leucine-rich repeat-containing protein 34 isoform X3 n=1 Tax=Archocentrus centrarchus TaxID=63155 RepID=UPI0011EA07E6|nr:leucine-rich repeat-containing protein 34 isoform X3 [Archocentrus centrarchus]
MMAAPRSLAELYGAVCAERQVKVNPDISRPLEETPETGCGRNFTLKLPGNTRPRQVQRLGDDDVLALCKCLQNSECVTGLDLRYNSITDGGAEHLAELLQEGRSSLRCLDLMFNDIQAAGARVLASSLQDTVSVMALISALRRNEALRSVDISRPLLFSHQEEWAVHCSAMLAVNSTLVELHLGKMGMTDTGMERLTEGLRRNRGLRYLDLRCNRVTRDGARHLASMLKQNRVLEIVDLSSNRIEDDGAAHLSEAISWPGCSLKELSVCRNSIAAEGLLSLAQAVKANTSLTHIYIWGNYLEEPVCQDFRELISSGRLRQEQTDVTPYEVDGHVFLAEVFQSLRKHVYSTDCDGTDVPAKTDATL